MCSTRYRTWHFFNNSNANEDIATKFEQEYVCCVKNEEDCVCSAPNCCEMEHRSARQPARFGSQCDILYNHHQSFTCGYYFHYWSLLCSSSKPYFMTRFCSCKGSVSSCPWLFGRDTDISKFRGQQHNLHE